MLVTNLLSNFYVGCLRADACRVHDGRHVDTGTTIEESPEETRQERDEWLKQQHKRNPLVIVDVCLDVLLGQTFSGDRFLHWQVVRVADPADRVGVLAVAGSKLRRTPASDRLSDKLLRRDKCAEADEDDDAKYLTGHVASRYLYKYLNWLWQMRMMTVYCRLSLST